MRAVYYTALALAICVTGCSTIRHTTDRAKTTASSVIQKLPLMGHSQAGNTVAPSGYVKQAQVKGIDATQPVPLTERLKPHGFSLGSWVDRRTGGLFQAVKPSPNKALVYLYRPKSNWNDQEIIAPSFFLNGKRVPSLRSGHYYWLELDPGVYRLAIRRPLGPVYFEKGTVVDMQVQPNERYYLRYDEMGYGSKPDPSQGLLQDGPLTQMTEPQAFRELAEMHLLSPGLQVNTKPYIPPKPSAYRAMKGKVSAFSQRHPLPELGRPSLPKLSRVHLPHLGRVSTKSATLTNGPSGVSATVTGVSNAATGGAQTLSNTRWYKPSSWFRR